MTEIAPTGGPPLTRAQKLADALLRDRERRNRQPTATRSRPRNDGFDPFAVTRWRVVAGGDPGYLPKTRMRMGPTGWFIACCHCGVEFESRGWAYCPTCMKLPPEERRRDAWLKARDCAPSDRPCQGPDCGELIPRRARADARYCSQRCAKKAENARAYASRLSGTAPLFSGGSTREFPQQNQGAISSLFAIVDFPKNLIGGDRRGRSPDPASWPSSAARRSGAAGRGAYNARVRGIR
jgi:hypothetical protein